MPIIGVMPSDYIPPISLEYLVIAGGGSGNAGGGGAGGLISNLGSPITTSYGVAHTIVVGAGGAPGSNGNNSSFNSNVAIGGGAGGGGLSGDNGQNGGSGGGAGYSGFPGLGTAGQGYPGGTADGSATGGGGASEPGSSYPYPQGGDGLRNFIAGRFERLAGGGSATQFHIDYLPGGDGGGGGSTGAPAYYGFPGSANTGGGGGGGMDPNTLSEGTNGGSGLVILRYPKEHNLSISSGLVYITYELGSLHKVTEFISGTGTATFTVV